MINKPVISNQKTRAEVWFVTCRPLLAAATTAVHGVVTATTLNNPAGITGINNFRALGSNRPKS